MTGAATMMGVATVLTKRWGRPPGMSSIGMTGWTFLLAGLTLLPITLLVEGLPRQLTGRNLGGLVYLVLISGIVAYALWFWGLQHLTASSVTFLSLLNPVVAAVLGWVVLDQRLNGLAAAGGGGRAGLGGAGSAGAPWTAFAVRAANRRPRYDQPS